MGTRTNEEFLFWVATHKMYKNLGIMYHEVVYILRHVKKSTAIEKYGGLSEILM